MPDKFDELMDQWDDDNDAEAQARKKAASEHAAFLDAFDAWARDVAVPALEVVGSRLRERGHRAEVQFTSRAQGKHPGEKVPRLQFQCAPKQEVDRGLLSMSTLAFSPNRERLVNVFESPSGRMAGTGRADRNLPLDGITGDQVEALAMELVEKTFTVPKTNWPPKD